MKFDDKCLLAITPIHMLAITPRYIRSFIDRKMDTRIYVHGLLVTIESIVSTIKAVGLEPPYSRYVLSAFKHAHVCEPGSSLSSTQFLESCDLKIDKRFMDEIHNAFARQSYVFISDRLIEYMGYTGEVNNMRRSFAASLKSFEAKFVNMSYDEYATARFRIMNETTYEIRGVEYKNKPMRSDMFNMSWPDFSSDKRSLGRRFILMKPDDIRMVMMRLSTSKGDEIRHHLLDELNLVNAYSCYREVYFRASRGVDRIFHERILEKLKKSHQDELDALHAQISDRTE